ncbi:uncharacterized protein LOC134194063 [Corticium candelabrum]|uniref:uncharacterized protein LOC134194063 n=1 Tax=Corticium candelabrum TaxID=121492 RepID=UPI002E26720A|nr:uncharacterized protein LOC134194063 [Corticium candelabrum]
MESVVNVKRSRLSAYQPQQDYTVKPLRFLELQGVIDVLNSYNTFDGSDIICCICGKPYKSRVCFTKHLWEHSIYWDLFDGHKNQDRVLAIQAAIILSRPYLTFLLVTSPQADKKKESSSGPLQHISTSSRKRKRHY